MIKSFGRLLLFGAVGVTGVAGVVSTPASAQSIEYLAQSLHAETIPVEEAPLEQMPTIIDDLGETPPPNNAISVDTITCRNLLSVGGDERSNLMVYMHGYMSGINGELTIDGLALAAATDDIVGACIDSPDSTLLSVFEDYR